MCIRDRDDNFTTVPFMNSGEIPPNWEDLVHNCSHLSTDRYFQLDQDWSIKAIDNLPVEDSMLVSEGEENSPKRRKVSFEKIPDITKDTTAPLEKTSKDKLNPLIMPCLPDINSLTLRRSPRIKDLQRQKQVSLSNMYSYFTYAASNFQSLFYEDKNRVCLLYKSPSPRDRTRCRMPASA